MRRATTNLCGPRGNERARGEDSPARPPSPYRLRRIVVRKEGINQPDLFGVDQPRLRHCRARVGVLALRSELLALEGQRSLLQR